MIRVMLVCEECGKRHRTYPGTQKCRKCRTNQGSRGLTNRGYVWIRLPPEDPMTVMNEATGHVVEHRLVMARHLGRPLLSTEVVHHRNHNLTDNRLQNLRLMTQSEHAKLHRRELKRRKVEQQLQALRIPLTRANIKRMSALMSAISAKVSKNVHRHTLASPLPPLPVHYKLLKPRTKAAYAPLPAMPESACRSGSDVL